MHGDVKQILAKAAANRMKNKFFNYQEHSKVPPKPEQVDDDCEIDSSESSRSSLIEDDQPEEN